MTDLGNTSLNQVLEKRIRKFISPMGAEVGYSASESFLEVFQAVSSLHQFPFLSTGWIILLTSQVYIWVPR